MESRSGGDTMKLLAVGLVALGTVGLLMMRNTKSAVSPQAPSRELAPLQLIQKIPAPGVAGRIDHFTASPKRRLLIFAALGNNSMEVVNTFEAKVVQSIKGLNEPQGVLYVPGFDKIFVANAGSGVVRVYDGKTYVLRKSIELGAESDTDNLRWDEDSKRVFVGVVGGIAMIDAANGNPCREGPQG
jgi:DNA-binding beta-propeller fold protein YncE